MAKTRLDLSTTEGLYRLGRTHPYGPPHDIVPKVKAQSYEQPDPAEQAVQDPEAMHGPGYDNDSKGWVRGHGSPHPHFDSGASGSRYK